jgi:hypothetical protein
MNAVFAGGKKVSTCLFDPEESNWYHRKILANLNLELKNIPKYYVSTIHLCEKLPEDYCDFKETTRLYYYLSSKDHTTASLAQGKLEVQDQLTESELEALKTKYKLKELPEDFLHRRKIELCDLGRNGILWTEANNEGTWIPAFVI